MRSSSGQASIEYVGLVSLVAVLIVGAAAIFPTGIPGRVAHGLRLGICGVTGTVCPRYVERAELEPCVQHTHDRRNASSLDVKLLTLGRDRLLRWEKFSDGHV